MNKRKTVKLGDICDILNGYAFKSKNYVDSGIRVIRITNVQKGYIEDSNPQFYPFETRKDIEKYMLYSGDLLMSLTGNVGRIAILTDKFLPAALNQRVACIRLKENSPIDKRLLFNMLNSDFFEQQCILSSNGVAQKNMSTEWLKEYQLPIFDIEIQQLITSTLDKVTHTIDLCNQIIEKLDLLIKAKFVEMFGDLIHNKQKWITCSVGDIAETVDPQPSHRTPPIVSNGIPYIGIAECNYNTQTIDFTNARKVGVNVLEEHIKRYSISEGDFIIGKIGTIGKPFFVPTDRTYTLSANTVLIQPNKIKINSQFLFAIFQSEYMNRIIDIEKKSTSQPAFGIQKVRAIEIPLPPLDLQNQFAAFVKQTEKSKSAVKQVLEKAETLKKALMQEYFG
ncbi:MAG: hypothetical protein HDT22_02285 [Ruminococcus sp.]|nr:hypothetical protein [Ruminococcus sp.]